PYAQDILPFGLGLKLQKGGFLIIITKIQHKIIHHYNRTQNLYVKEYRHFTGDNVISNKIQSRNLFR
ncbi:MAG: hypothetical protein PHU88_03600, partial [candidate division Zixibacteria bacterium]|nr:hypothetical protein [candidate division Zixibacteria bacterium]